eukprot:663765-Prymnesium_polylepis.1
MTWHESTVTPIDLTAVGPPPVQPPGFIKVGSCSSGGVQECVPASATAAIRCCSAAGSSCLAS